MGKKLFSILFILAVMCSANTAWADKGWHGRGHGHNKHWDDGDDDVRIRSSDRVVIHRYIEEDYSAHCPPGLAKKHNGCLPPGQAKKHYVIGRALPEYVVYEPAPVVLVQQLQPVPPGYQYVVVDKDVLLISEASKRVIDAITLYSAVGR